MGDVKMRLSNGKMGKRSHEEHSRPGDVANSLVTHKVVIEISPRKQRKVPQKKQHIPVKDDVLASGHPLYNDHKRSNYWSKVHESNQELGHAYQNEHRHSSGMRERHVNSHLIHKHRLNELSSRQDTKVGDPDLKDVKRRLDFHEDGDGLDFTDKMAALRSLLTKKKYSPARDIESTRSKVGGEGLSSHIVPEMRNLISDEIGLDGSRRGETLQENSFNSGEDLLVRQNIWTVKDRLLDKRKKRKEILLEDGKVTDTHEKIESPCSEKVSEDNRCVNISAKTAPSDGKQSHKQTQTHGIATKKFAINKMVQSNSPYFKPKVDKTDEESLLCSSFKPLSSSQHLHGSHSHLGKSHDHRGHNGIAEGILMEGRDVNSGGPASVLEKKQTNVRSFVGSSLALSKEHHLKPRENSSQLKSGRKSKEEVNNTENEKVNLSDVKSLRKSTGNRRRHNSKERDQYERTKEKLNAINQKCLKFLQENKFDIQQSDDEKILDEGKNRFVDKLDKLGGNLSKDIHGNLKKNKDGDQDSFVERIDRPMSIDELSVENPVTSSSWKLRRESAVESSQLNGSYDEIPVKLDKAESERSREANGVEFPLFNRFLHPTIAAGYGGPITGYHGDQNRLVLQFPVEDGLVSQTPQRRKRRESSADSVCAESVSSGFSTRSVESVSSTVQAVSLLRKLYKVDPQTRQNLVLMAKCFRRWLSNVRDKKQYHLEQQLLTTTTAMNPVSYGVMLQTGEIFYRTHLLTQMFDRWKDRIQAKKLLNQARSIHRRHMLQKGMNAFKWAINRSKLRQGIMQDKVNSIMVAVTFRKWRAKAIANRKQRLHDTISRWRRYTKEAQRIRMLRDQTNHRLLQRVFMDWCCKFEIRLKQNKADMHLRLVLLSHGWASWKMYTMITKEKKHRQNLARVMYEESVQRKTLREMRIASDKYKKAKDFNRHQQLKCAMVAWRQGTQVCKVERLQDTRVAVEYWCHMTVQAMFNTWRELMLERKACRMCDRNIIKHTFNHWNIRCKRRIQKREEIEAYIRQRIMKRAVFVWRYTVTMLKKRRAAAVVCIEACLQEHVLQVWHRYTMYQKDLRKRLKRHIRKQELKTQKRFLIVWRCQYQDRCDEQRAKQFWSNICARKAAEKWRLICHKRKMKKLLEMTEPVRQLNLQRVMFQKWLLALEKVEDEKHEAGEVRAILERSQLHKFFTKWRDAAEQHLKIKPMVLRYRYQLVSSFFKSWHEHVRHKAECKSSEQLFLKSQLRRRFGDWRRQYLIHQLEKSFNKKVVENYAHRCIQGWRQVIWRKHAAIKFHENQLVKTAFSHWSYRAVRQIRWKKLEKEEIERNISILREYFDLWQSNVHVQITETEEAIHMALERQENNLVRNTFTFWRRLFRATLVARENQRILCRRLARQALQEWHHYSQRSIKQAVVRFAAAIGVHVQEEDGAEWVQPVIWSRDSFTDQPELMLDSLEMQVDSLPSYTSPRHASSYGTPLRRLFSPSVSRIGLEHSQEFDRGSLVDTSFLDARFEMEQAVRTERMREIVIVATTRLRHWPVSVVFDQWKEYTVRQRELKSLSAQMSTLHEMLTLTATFKTWVKQYQNMMLAQEHWNIILKQRSLVALYRYRVIRQQKKRLSALAHSHYSIRVYARIFPMWFSMAQEKQQKEKIVHLWTSTTPEELALIPAERSFTRHLHRKSMLTCFKIWFVRFQQLITLKKVYHGIILDRCFSAWYIWSKERKYRCDKSREFREHRVKTMVFRRWCLRHTQKTEVARRYDDVWNNYLGLILSKWHTWAKANKMRKMLAVRLTSTLNMNLVTSTFITWKTATQKHLLVKKWYQKHLTHRVIEAWRDVAVWQIQMKKKMLQFQIRAYTKLVQRQFRTWHGRYLRRMKEHEEHEQTVQRYALQIARFWRKKAQKSRSRQLQQHFQQEHVRQLFAKWRQAYSHNMDREEVLHSYLEQKNSRIVAEFMDRWRMALMTIHARRLYNQKLVATVITEWLVTAKGCKERRVRMQSLLIVREHRTQKAYFSYWVNLVKVRQSIRSHANLRVQLSVLKGWLEYTRRQRLLRRLQTAYTARSNRKLLANTWYTMRTKFDYCRELTEIAHKVQRDKNRLLMRKTLEFWYEALKRVIAGHCYQHLLARKTIRKWHGYVQRRKDERRKEAEQEEKAVRHYHRKLCRIAYIAWHDEVLVSHQVQRRKKRLERKYFKLWKQRLDMMYTAKCQYEENVYKFVWGKWHLAFAQRKVVKQMLAVDNRQLLSKVFHSWRSLYMKHPLVRRVSQIPLPVSPTLSLPSSGSDSVLSEEGSSSSSGGVSRSQIPTPMASSRGPQITNNSRNKGKSSFTPKYR